MKITQLGIVVCTLSTGLTVSGDVWPTLINTTRSNIKGHNMTVNEVGVEDITAEGDVNVDVTYAPTGVINTTRSNIKGMAGNVGVNVVSETELSTAVSGNIVFADAPSLDGTEGTAMMGNSISTSAFEGATGVIVVNMNNGHNSSIQSPMSIIVTPR